MGTHVPMAEPRTVRRSVRSEDPSLSDEANRLLTEELRRAVGRDEVEVPADALDRSRERHGAHGAIVTTLIANGTVLLFTFLALVVVGVIVSLATGSWWALAIAVGVHALGTMIAAASAVALTTEVEHADPSTAARLEEEGVPDPDRVLTELVEDYGGATQAPTGVEATTAQRRAMTPSADGSRAVGGSLPGRRSDG